MKKVLKIIGIIFIIILVLILILDIVIVVKSKTKPDEVPSIFGYKPFIVMSGSMLSKIEIGDLVLVKEVNPDTLEVNDIIAFKDSEDIVTTHRIINIVNENGKKAFETKGDSNNVKDENVVHPENIEGIYAFKISRLGKFILFIQEPSGFAIMVLIILVIGTIFFMLEEKSEDKKDKKNTKNKIVKIDEIVKIDKNESKNENKDKIINVKMNEQDIKEFEEFKEFKEYKRLKEQQERLERQEKEKQQEIEGHKD